MNIVQSIFHAVTSKQSPYRLNTLTHKTDKKIWISLLMYWYIESKILEPSYTINVSQNSLKLHAIISKVLSTKSGTNTYNLGRKKKKLVHITCIVPWCQYRGKVCTHKPCHLGEFAGHPFSFLLFQKIALQHQEQKRITLLNESMILNNILRWSNSMLQ